jgi:hypothetical protein
VPRALPGAPAVRHRTGEQSHRYVLGNLFHDEKEVQRLEEQGGNAQWARLREGVEVEPGPGISPRGLVVSAALERLVGTQLLDDAEYGRRAREGAEMSRAERGEGILGKLDRDVRPLELLTRKTRGRHVAMLPDAGTRGRGRRQDYVGTIEQGVLCGEQPVLTSRDDAISDDEARQCGVHDSSFGNMARTRRIILVLPSSSALGLGATRLHDLDPIWYGMACRPPRDASLRERGTRDDSLTTGPSLYCRAAADPRKPP